MPERERDGEASSRPSMSDRERDRDRGGDREQGPIPLFDLHLRFLSDSYLAFFNERKKIEEAYIESLLKLHKRARVIDTYLDDQSELSSSRKAWREVVDHAERESQTRQAFLTSLTVDVITPLASFRETQDRTRKRIREDIKSAAQGYDDYADTLAKLKARYIRRCQDAEELRAGASPTAPGPMSPTDTHAPPVVTAPQPLRPLARRASGGAPVPRTRSPSSSTALQDLAHQGKRQLNQLMTFLDKRDTTKDGLGGTRGDPLRGVRAKREADEADREYRKGVHWLETLRLRRLKLLEAGAGSLQSFVAESAERVKRALAQYTDTLAATAQTQAQLGAHLADSVARIAPAADGAAVGARVPRAAVPGPVYYYNYAVGECPDLVWGISLVDYATDRGLADGELPKVVRICIREVDARGLDAEGIYRVSGRLAAVQELQRRIEANERAFRFSPATDDVFIVSALLKLYLRDLPEPVFRFPLQDRLQHSADLEEHRASGFTFLRAKLRRLPPVHYAVLRAVVEHLARVAAHAARNKMDVRNLAIVFGGMLFGEDELPRGGAELLALGSAPDSVMENLIENAAVIFDERAEGAVYEPPPPSKAVPASSKPLPPPVLVPAPAPTTPRTEAPPPVFPGSPRPEAVSDAPRVSAEDFAPRVPTRPPMSIHPSARGDRSPTKASFADERAHEPRAPDERERERGRSPVRPPPERSPRQRLSALQPPAEAARVPPSPTADALAPPKLVAMMLVGTGPGHLTPAAEGVEAQLLPPPSAETFTSASSSPVAAETPARPPPPPPPQPIPLPTPTGDQAYVFVPFPSMPATPGRPPAGK